MVDHLTLPIGLPGQGMHLGVDPLSALFLCILAPQVLAGAVAEERGSVAFWVFVLAMVLALLAADAFTLILGLALMSAAFWLLLRGEAEVGTLFAGVALFSNACLVPAFYLPPGNFAFILLLLGVGAMAGLAPLHFWLPRAQVPSAGISALLSGGMVKVALYVLIRYGLVLFGGAIQPWWGGVLMLVGALSVGIGALRAMLEVELKTVLACSTVQHVGLITVGLGVALQARALDDPALCVMACQAALLCAVAHSLFKPLLFLGAAAVQRSVGSTSLNWLGGLLRAMPRMAVLMLVGVAGMAALPLGPGFAPEFLLLHAVIGAAGSGGILAWIGYSALLGLLGMSAVLSLGAAIRLFGIGFLGRPRSLHAAAAEEPGRAVLTGMGLLAALCVPVALAPGLLLRAMQPVFALLVPGAVAEPLAYQPLTLAVLLGLPALAAFLLLRRVAPPGEREVQSWNGGFGKPPVWLPFGDPATQPSATGFAEPVWRVLGHAMLRQGRDPGERFVLAPLAAANLRATRLAERLRRATIRQLLAGVFAVLVVVLLALGCEPG